MVLRKAGIGDAYDRLKIFSHGKRLSIIDLHRFIDEQLIIDSEKSRLKSLSPATYVGLAGELF